VDVLAGQLLAVKLFKVLPRRLQTLQQGRWYQPSCRLHLPGTYSHILQGHAVKAGGKFPHRRIAPLLHALHNRLHLRQHPLHIGGSALQQALLFFPLKLRQTPYPHHVLLP
jgi:hypothetical protein